MNDHSKPKSSKKRQQSKERFKEVNEKGNKKHKSNINLSNNELSKKIKNNLQQIEKKLKTNSQTVSDTLISQQVLNDLKEGSKCSSNTKLLCARIIMEIFDQPHLRHHLREIGDVIIGLMMDVLMNFSERAVTNFVQEALKQSIVSIFTMNIGDFCKNGGLNSKSIFYSMLLDYVLVGLQTSIDKRVKKFRLELIVEFTKSIGSLAYQLDSKQMDKVLQCFREYINKEGVNFSNFHDQDVCKQPFLWAFQSCNSKCMNSLFFDHVMLYLREQAKKKLGEYMGLITCFFLAFEQKNTKNIKDKFIVLIRYQDLFLNLIQANNIEDNMKENSLGVLVDHMFKLAQFCNQAKKHHILQKVFKQAEEIVGEAFQTDRWSIQQCQSSLYRTLICIQKSLPNYPLKYYAKGIIEQPGLFHLYLMQDIFEKREQQDVLELMISLIQKWINNEMREFNILSNVSKFILVYLKKQTQSHIQSLIFFFNHLSHQAFSHLNYLFYEASFVDFPRSQLYLMLPTSLACTQQSFLIQSCGFAAKTFFIDQHFSFGPELFDWSPLLLEIYEDWFYFSLKHFYGLIQSAMNIDCSNTMDYLISQFQQILHKSTNNKVYSTFQIIACVDVCCFTQKNLKDLLKIILCGSQTIISYLQNNSKLVWKQTLKTLQTHSQLLQSYRKQQERGKKMYWQFISSIMYFVQKIANAKTDICSLIPKQISFQQAIDIINKYYNHITTNSSNYLSTPLPPPCYRIIRILSFKAAKNVFAKEAIQKINNPSNTKLLRPKMLIIRQLIFAYLQAKSVQQTQNLRQICDEERALEFCLDILQCVECEHFEKQMLVCKILVVECISEIYHNIENNSNALAFKSLLCGSISAKNRLKQLIIRLVMRDTSLLLAKYQRKMVLIIRSKVISLICHNTNICMENQYHFSGIEQTALALWHLGLDQQIQIRIKVLSILTDSYQKKYQNIQHQIFQKLAILTLMQTLGANRSVIGYASKIIDMYATNLNKQMGFSLILALTLGFFIFNSKVNLPSYQIFNSFLNGWLKSKEQQYLFLVVIEELEKNNAIFRKIELCQNHSNLGSQLKICHINLKNKRGWVNWKDDGKTKNETILKNMKQVIVDKNKRNCRYLKSKKDALINWPQIESFNLLQLHKYD